LADGHYFWQDLICARWIFENNAENHLDIGSRLDGFIAHLLAFRKVTVLDIRPLHNDRIDGLTYCQGDAQSELSSYHEKFDSVSSLHSIEHFGLGRYGDSLQADGHIRGLINIAQCVSRGGVLYVSFPIGFDKVEFNAQRIIDPTKILEAIDGFEIEKICIIPWKGEPEFLKSIQDINLQKHGQVGLFQIRRLT
jgi:hypothetical protein